MILVFTNDQVSLLIIIHLDGVIMSEERTRLWKPRTQAQEAGSGDSDKNVSDIDFWKLESKNNVKEAQSLRKRLRETEAQIESDKQSKLAEEGSSKNCMKNFFSAKNYQSVDEKFKQLAGFAESIILKNVPEEYHDIVPNVPIEEKLHRWKTLPKGLFKKVQSAGVSGHHASVSSSQQKELDYTSMSDDNKKALKSSVGGGGQRKL